MLLIVACSSFAHMFIVVYVDKVTELTLFMQYAMHYYPDMV